MTAKALFGVLGAALAFLAPSPLRAQATAESLDHAGSVGLLVAAGGEYSTIAFAPCPTCRSSAVGEGVGLALDLGGTVAVGQEGGELEARVRLVRGGDTRGESLMLGYRSYHGREEWKSFFALAAHGSVRPIKAGGARAAFGLMRELSSVLGLFSELGATFGLGEGRRFGVELVAGLQARSFLLE